MIEMYVGNAFTVDFRFKQENQVYRPGDIVSGTAVLKLKSERREMETVHIKCELGWRSKCREGWGMAADPKSKETAGIESTIVATDLLLDHTVLQPNVEYKLPFSFVIPEDTERHTYTGDILTTVWFIKLIVGTRIPLVGGVYDSDETHTITVNPPLDVEPQRFIVINSTTRPIKLARNLQQDVGRWFGQMMPDVSFNTLFTQMRPSDFHYMFRRFMIRPLPDSHFGEKLSFALELELKHDEVFIEKLDIMFRVYEFSDRRSADQVREENVSVLGLFNYKVQHVQHGKESRPITRALFEKSTSAVINKPLIAEQLWARNIHITPKKSLSAPFYLKANALVWDVVVTLHTDLGVISKQFSLDVMSDREEETLVINVE